MRLYQASPIKRARKAELESRKSSLFESVFEIHSCTVRQCFYQAKVRSLGEMTEPAQCGSSARPGRVVRRTAYSPPAAKQALCNRSSHELLFPVIERI
jgi:hypothetical protein